MKNIFIQLKAKALLKKEPLLKMLNIDPEEEDMPAYLESYFESETEATVKQNASFILTLTEHHQEHATKDKLYALLVFFTSKLSIKEINEITLSVEKST